MQLNWFISVTILVIAISNVRTQLPNFSLYTARRYASKVLAVIMCLSVCLSHADIVSKRLNVESWKQRHTKAQGLSLFLPKIMAKFKQGRSNGGTKCKLGRLK